MKSIITASIISTLVLSAAAPAHAGCGVNGLDPNGVEQRIDRNKTADGSPITLGLRVVGVALPTRAQAAPESNEPVNNDSGQGVFGSGQGVFTIASCEE